MNTYSVPRQAQEVFTSGILENHLMPDLPTEAKTLAQNVRFEGSDQPSIPINWRFAESISALKAFEATLLNCLLGRKYNATAKNITINT